VQAVLDAFDELADGLGLVSGGLIGGVEFEIHAGIIAEKTGGCSSSRAQRRGDLPMFIFRYREERSDLPFIF
jgi:hypothetical protein